MSGGIPNLCLDGLSLRLDRLGSKLDSNGRLGLQVELVTDPRFIVGLTDKNLGPAIMETNEYLRPAYCDHLSDTTTYQRLTKEEAETIQDDTALELRRLVEAKLATQSEMEQLYFKIILNGLAARKH